MPNLTEEFIESKRRSDLVARHGEITDRLSRLASAVTVDRGLVAAAQRELAEVEAALGGTL